MSTDDSSRMYPARQTHATPGVGKPLDDGAVVGLAALEVLVREDGRRDAVLGRPLQTGRIGAVGDDHRHLGGDLAGRTRPGDGLHVGTATGDEDAEFRRHTDSLFEFFDFSPRLRKQAWGTGWSG